MPFTVTKPQPHGKLYITLKPNCFPLWTADKSHATPFTEVEAETLATEINRFASTLCQVEGIRYDDEVAPCE